MGNDRPWAARAIQSTSTTHPNFQLSSPTPRYTPHSLVTLFTFAISETHQYLGRSNSDCPCRTMKRRQVQNWLTIPAPSNLKSATRWIPSPLFFKNKPGVLVCFKETMEGGNEITKARRRRPLCAFHRHRSGRRYWSSSTFEGADIFFKTLIVILQLIPKAIFEGIPILLVVGAFLHSHVHIPVTSRISMQATRRS